MYVHELVPSLKLKYSYNHIFCINCPSTNQLLVIIQELNLHSFASQVATNRTKYKCSIPTVAKHIFQACPVYSA